MSSMPQVDREVLSRASCVRKRTPGLAEETRRSKHFLVDETGQLIGHGSVVAEAGCSVGRPAQEGLLLDPDVARELVRRVAMQLGERFRSGALDAAGGPRQLVCVPKELVAWLGRTRLLSNAKRAIDVERRVPQAPSQALEIAERRFGRPCLADGVLRASCRAEEVASNSLQSPPMAIWQRTRPQPPNTRDCRTYGEAIELESKCHRLLLHLRRSHSTPTTTAPAAIAASIPTATSTTATSPRN